MGMFDWGNSLASIRVWICGKLEDSKSINCDDVMDWWEEKVKAVGKKYSQLYIKSK